MHGMGPTAMTLRLIKGRGKLPAEAATTSTFRTLGDVPPKVYAYNSMIAVHAVCEAILVLAGGLVPIILNVTLVDPCEKGAKDYECSVLTAPVPQGTIIGNTFLSFFWRRSSQTVFSAYL